VIMPATAELPADDFAYLCRLMHERAAIVLEPGKEYLALSRLDPIARHAGVRSVAELVDVLRGEDVASPLQIFEEDRLVGTTNIGRLLLPPGVHVLDFVSDELGFRAQRTVTVRPGAATAVALELPAVTLSINAQPWAEVFVDGDRVGETPIGTLSRPVGRHEVVLRHPEFGERRRTVTLTTNGPNRISVDMRRP